jgi:type IV pilus assembly protein PilX
MINTVSILKNDRGSTIIVAMLILVFLTIIGISAINTSTFEMQIVGNEHRYQIDFYVADSGWKEGAMWLESLTGPPPEVNPGSDSIVRNWGDAGGSDPPPALQDEDVLASPDNLADSDGIDNDGDSQIDEAGELSLGQPYWYQVEYEEDGTVAGSGKGLREFVYRIASNANQTQEIEVIVAKQYKVGY